MDIENSQRDRQPDYANWGVTKILGGGNGLHGHCTQLTIAITDSAMHDYENADTKQCCIDGSSEQNFWFIPQTVTFWGTIVANEVQIFFI